MEVAMARVLFSVVLCACLSLACKQEGGTSASTEQPAKAGAIKIGVLNSITGPEAPIGETMGNGIALAEEDLAKAGIQLQVIREDDTGKPQVAMSGFEKLATRDEVVAVVGPYTSSSSNAVARLAQRYKVPVLIPAASKEDITKQGFTYVFRLNATSEEYASVVIDDALSLGKAQTLALVYENTDFGTSAAKAAREYAAKKSLKIVADEAYSKGSPDYRSTLSRLKAANPDLIFMVSYVADAILLMRQSRELQLTPKAFLGGGAGFTTNQFAAEKDISNGVFSSTQWTDDVNWPGAKEWAQRYRTKFGKEPTYHAACGYAAMLIMGNTVAKAGGDRDKIRDALKAGEWEGIMGHVKFEDYEGFTNQNKHPMLVVQAQDGKYFTVYPPQFSSGKPVYPFPGWK
jgi:branched-chain amino acid transport system substrate-binding protein